MTGTEIAYLVGALTAVFLFLFLVRRASGKSEGVKERLEATPDTNDDERAPSARRGDDDDDDDEQETSSDGHDDRADDDHGVDLRDGLAKTRGGFVARLGKLFARKRLDDDLLAELEQVLFTADIGPKTADSLFQALKQRLSKDELSEPEAVWETLREQSRSILAVDTPALDFARTQPFVLLVIGVNGVGKTTTIGKIAAKLRGDGKRVLLGAGDTFRAAAVEQLEVWGERAEAPVVKGKPGSDPSSVIFETIKRGVEEDYDVVICDTAGRLHTKVDLMEELKKVGRSCEKALPGCPHETWLVLDATTGQNAIQQAQLFREAVDISGIVLTKLDGTAKGGVILGICDQMGLPVRYIGIGEGVSDLREFDPEEFVSALYEQAEAVDAA
ncbi:MAG: signal recognition particle-docking protein FtsY [Haliangiales bacterium]